jgi:hypothetical protein
VIEELQRTSLDSYADTCCAGPNFKVMEMSEEKVNVFPFSEKLSAVKDIPIATVATIWEDPHTGEMWLLIIHEALYFGQSLQESLLCPNQLQSHGIKVNNKPVQFDPSSLHSIIISKRVSMNRFCVPTNCNPTVLRSTTHPSSSTQAHCTLSLSLTNLDTPGNAWGGIAFSHLIANG